MIAGSLRNIPQDSLNPMYVRGKATDDAGRNRKVSPHSRTQNTDILGFGLGVWRKVVHREGKNLDVS